MLAAATAVIAVIGLAVTVGRSLEPSAVSAEPLITLFPTTTATTLKPQPKPQVPVTTFLATPAGVIPTFDQPGGRQIGTAGLYYGYPVTLPILKSTNDGWLRVRLPERPNGSTAWVHRNQVAITSTPYRIVIRRSTTKVTLYKSGFPVLTIPAGIGKASTPTPLGSFFVAVIEQPGPAGYGPIVFDTSGHSEAIQSWEGSGDAVIALHGPISSSSDARIGSAGTYISNGCVRLHLADQVKLSDVPLGAPVDIVD